jgi:hypothetical protein
MAGVPAVIRPWEVNQATAAAPASQVLQSPNNMSWINQRPLGTLIGNAPANQGAAPRNANAGYGTYAGSAGAGTSAITGQYDQAIGNTQAAINRLGNQLNSGFSGIDASYQNTINQLLLSKNQGEAAYGTNKKQAATDYVGAKNTIGSNAGTSLNSLLRLLGSRGAGGGSAYTQAAPQAVARQATIQRSDAGSTSARNNQALDTNWGNFMTGYNNQVSSASNQREQQKQSLQQNIENNRATLLQSLAQLAGQRAQAAGGNARGASQPYLDQANAILDRTSNYAIAPINYQTQAYQAPDLASYNTAPNATPAYQGEAQGNDYVSPYLQVLLGRKQQQLA